MDAYADRDEERSKFLEWYSNLFPEHDVYRHYKGGLYVVKGEGHHTETNEALVSYQHIWPHVDSSLRFRPAENFHGTVETEDGDVDRFEWVA